MDFVVEFFNDFVFLFTDIIPEFFRSGFAYLGKLMVYAGLYLKLSGMKFAFDIASEIMVDLDISNHIQQSFSLVSSDALRIANYFKITTFIESIMTAYTTRFVIGFFK